MALIPIQYLELLTLCLVLLGIFRLFKAQSEESELSPNPSSLTAIITEPDPILHSAKKTSSQPQQTSEIMARQIEIVPFTPKRSEPSQKSINLDAIPVKNNQIEQPERQCHQTVLTNYIGDFF